MRHTIACLLAGAGALFANVAVAQPVPPPPPPSATTAPPPPPGTPIPPGGPAPNAQPTVGQPPPPPPGTPPPPMPGQPGQPPPGQPPMMGPPGQPQPGQPPMMGPPGQPPMMGPPGQPPPGQGMWMPGQTGMPPMGEPEPIPVPGLARGVPWSRRGNISLETAGFTDDSGEDSLLAVGLNVHMPMTKSLFVDARLPMAGILPGNIMLGVSATTKLDPRGFLYIGGQFGLPIASQPGMIAFSLPHGTWNLHEYQSYFLPIRAAFGYERMLGEMFELRIDLEPILSIPIGDHGNNVGFTLQHAAEFQVGHSIGGGLRLQGVAVTEDLLPDAYQFSIEPFFVVRREIGFARIGLMLPIDDSIAGPAFEQAWGLRLGAGIHIN